jgi:hypothetical protein
MALDLRFILEAMERANALILDYRNNPEKIYNNARQVDPVSRGLRVAIAQIEEELNGPNNPV